MNSLIKSHINLNHDYNFRHIAKLRENQRMEFQPCYDERFHPARVNYEHMGEILRAKHEKEVIKRGGMLKDYNKKKVNFKSNTETIKEEFILIINKTTDLWKKLIMKK